MVTGATSTQIFDILPKPCRRPGQTAGSQAGQVFKSDGVSRDPTTLSPGGSAHTYLPAPPSACQPAAVFERRRQLEMNASEAIDSSHMRMTREPANTTLQKANDPQNPSWTVHLGNYLAREGLVVAAIEDGNVQ